jgi:hypothetical protein
VGFGSRRKSRNVIGKLDGFLGKDDVIEIEIVSLRTSDVGQNNANGALESSPVLIQQFHGGKETRILVFDRGIDGLLARS